MQFPAVFMVEGRRLVTGEAILSAARIEHNRLEGDQAASTLAEIANSQTAAGIEAQVEALVREHSRLVYRIAYAALRSHHDAEDATQETFMRVLRYSSKLAQVENPKTWLARIAWRVAVDRSKRRGRAVATSLDDPENPVVEVASAETLPDDALRGAQLGAAIGKMIAALPGKLREPLILSAIEEMSPAEIGVTLGMSEAAVRSRVFRARQILKEKFAQQTGRNR